MDGTPTGATALICPQDLKPPNSRGKRQGTWDPPGYVSRRDRSGNWIFNRSHIIGDRFNGDWIRENIFTGFKAMNDPAMKKLENKMASALAAKQPVLYSGQLEYGNGRDNIPTGIRMTAATPNGVLFAGVLVPNVP
ncbi:DNA/RNA non-specific endonuclease [Streptomyces sp. NPDC006997]|uniref:DNA/RNA non-specific endonuclease n=1 Tax=Streptomyces sp. NPDC006997 TaxID=3155356 RepID=UPI0033CC015B